MASNHLAVLYIFHYNCVPVLAMRRLPILKTYCQPQTKPTEPLVLLVIVVSVLFRITASAYTRCISKLSFRCAEMYQAVSEGNIFFRNRPIRNKNCLWWPYLLANRSEMSNRYRWSSIDAAYQVSVHTIDNTSLHVLRDLCCLIFSFLCSSL
jgi:hypothetical protein